ncbi:MAG: Ig-like domain-containing protein [Acidobacteriota bacterium]
MNILKVQRLSAVIFSVILMSLSAKLPAQAICVKGRTTDKIFPFFGNTESGFSSVTLYGNEAARNATFLPLARVQQGTERWNSGCPVKKSLPTFQVNWKQNRPAGGDDMKTDVYRTSMLVDYRPNEAAIPDSSHGGFSPALWDSGSNTIVLYGKCPSDGTHGLECFPNSAGGTIRWDSEWGAFVIAHEIGHALGLDDDPNDGCSHGLMKSPSTETDSGLGASQYCRFVNATNDSQNACNSEATEPGEANPCENARIFGRPGGFVAGGHSVDFCSESPWSCYNDSSPRWGGGLDCTYACITVTEEGGGSSTSCDWQCTSVGVSGENSVGNLQAGLAPFLLVDSPQQSQAVSGLLSLAGFATDLTGAVSISFGIDGIGIRPQGFVSNLQDARACELPHGIQHSACNDDSGFSGSYDTSSLTNGSHLLGVVAIDPAGWPTEVSIPFSVDNGPCGDILPPTTQITSPSVGATVSGAVTLVAAASDNRGVARVDFYVDEQNLGGDMTVPYSVNWNAAAVANGPHSVRAQAYDACGNSTSSPLRTIQVLGETSAPTAILTSPAPNSQLRGTVSIQAAASDNVGVAKVDFYLDGVVLATDTTAPFSINWNTANTTAGAHSLLAKAYDTAGNSGTSPSVAVTVDNVAPNVYIDSPSAGLVVSGNAVLINGWAIDANRVVSLAFQLDGQALALNGPYTFGLGRADACAAVPVGDPNCPFVGWRAYFDSTLFSAGLHTLAVTATDGAGNPWSFQRNFTINNDTGAPSVNFTAPVNGALLRGTVSVQATAADNVAVTRVELYLDGALIGSDTTAPYAFSWNTTSASEGTHTLTLKAYDSVPNVGIATRSVTVDNVHPQVRIVCEDGTLISLGTIYTMQNTVVGASVSRQFTLFNDGNEALTITNPSALVSGTGFSQIGTAPSGSIAPGGSSIFRVRLLAASAGGYTGAVSLQTNEIGATPFTFGVQGTVSASVPNISVWKAFDGTAVAKGTSVSIGTTTANTTISVRFRIDNNGSGNLNLTNATSLVGGAGFSQIETPVGPVAPGSSAYFRVRLLAATAGNWSGTVSILSDDPNDSPYSFTVTGTVN